MWSPPGSSKRVSFTWPGAAALALLALGVGCGPPQHVGRPCEIGTTAAGGASGQIATVSSPALECPSRVCLLAGQNAPATGPLCTAECESTDDCQDGETANAGDPADKRCHGGFVCTWPTTVGAFACKKMCVCTDFVTGGSTKPAACN
jgi:hypothetical protein